MTKLIIGELVPLELQLSDGTTGLFPRALVYDASGTLIATKDLAHVANGRYANDTLVMPSSGYVAATYIVYSDSGHTTLAGYARSVEVWQIDATVAAIKAKTDNLPATPADGTTIATSFGVIAIAIAALPSAAAIATAVLNAAIDGAKTVRGALTRVDAFVKGKATGLNSATATFYAADGTTPVIVANQDTTAGTRAAPTTAAGD